METEQMARVRESMPYLVALSRQYPTVRDTTAEIIAQEAILRLPKGTEHFMSDLHGEYEAFQHIMNNASGVIREKVDALFEDELPANDRARLAALIYYPEEKLEAVKKAEADMPAWYDATLRRLLCVCRLVASKYTRDKVRRALPEGYQRILDELLHEDPSGENKEGYFDHILRQIIALGCADAFIVALTDAIKRLTVDKLHIVGDIFDRGARPDIIMDALIRHHDVDVQWGNHDILWMGAAAGSRTCIANVLNNSITYHCLDVLEMGYGISLRPLALFANDAYADADIACFLPRVMQGAVYSQKDLTLVARMHKAVAVMLFKLEGMVILRNPSFRMEDRLLLNHIDFDAGTVAIGGKKYPLRDCDFPTIDPDNPYQLTPDEAEVMALLASAFSGSEKLQRHVRFLYANGGLYHIENGNLLFHGCVPMTPEGGLAEFEADGRVLSGRAYMDYVDTMVRQGYYALHGSKERQRGKDFLWFLWCGNHSPLFGRERMTTFERLLIADERAWAEPKDPYYTHIQRRETCEMLLSLFGLAGENCHIVNGHVPVRASAGESPVKADGKLIVIDGGFCRAYQPRTGIAGYTLISNSHGLRLISHGPFCGVEEAVRDNADILSSSTITETARERILVEDTDGGFAIREMITGLRLLLDAYRLGALREKPRDAAR